LIKKIAKEKHLQSDDNSLLSQLMQNETGLPFKDIYCGVMGTMLAAFINTAGTLTWLLAELMHPVTGKQWWYVTAGNWQLLKDLGINTELRQQLHSDKAVAEQKQIIAEHGPQLTMAALNSMDFLGRAIAEIGRKYSLFGHHRMVWLIAWRTYVVVVYC
jgi:cytochrome P450